MVYHLDAKKVVFNRSKRPHVVIYQATNHPQAEVGRRCLPTMPLTILRFCSSGGSDCQMNMHRDYAAALTTAVNI